MARAKKEDGGWSLSSNEYRIGIAVLFAGLIGLLTWLGNGIITGQSEIRDELEVGNSNLNTMRGEVNALRTEITRLDTGQKGEAARLESMLRDQESRLTRTNDRQTDQADRLTRMETRMEAYLGSLKK